MKSLHSFSNHVGSQSAGTIKALAHGLGSTFSRVGERDTASVPSKSLGSDPLSFTIGGSNPDTSFTFGMDDCERPLSLELENIKVGNYFSLQGINDFDAFFGQNELRSNPNEVSGKRQDCTEEKFRNYLHRAGVDHDAICCEEQNQNKRRSSPDKITFGSKSFRHKPSIAGEIR